jgi:PAS domain S-box-containing protein
VAEALWAHTVAAYLDNPLPAVFKETVLAVCSRSCSVPYCVVCHSCALRPLGLGAAEIRRLLEAPEPGPAEVASYLATVRAASPVAAFPARGTPLYAALVGLTVHCFADPGGAGVARAALRDALGPERFTHWAALLAYVRACHEWVEAHPELSWEADWRAREHLGPLLEEDPALAELLANHRWRLRAEPWPSATAVVESMPDAIVIVDDHGRIVLANAQAEKLFGWPPGTMTGAPVEELLPEPLREVHRAHRTGYVRAPRVRPMGAGLALEGRRADGTTLPVEISLSPLVVAADRSLVVAAVRDISDRRRAEEALRESEERFRKIFEEGPVGIAVVGPDLRLQQVNAAFAAITGRSPEELVGRSFAEITHPDDVDADVELARRVFAGELPSYRIEKRYLRPDGEAVWVDLTAAAVRDEAGGVRYGLAIVADISARKRAEAEREAAMAELQRSNAELAQFAYLASHDLQEPLRMVAGYVQLLARRYRGRLDATADEFIGYAVDGVERMQTLIRDLLDYCRIDAASRPFVDVDLGEVVSRVLSSLEPSVAASGATVEVGPLPVVRGDHVQLGQVFQNLLTNALKFVAPGTAPAVVVAARLSDDGREWVVSVSDNGIGVEPRFAERIFGMFQRLHTRDAYPGTGIGLAICKRVVERHGGRIWVEPRPSGGSIFSFTIPAAAEGEGVHG